MCELLVRGTCLDGGEGDHKQKSHDSNLCTKNWIKYKGLFLSKCLHSPKEPWPVAAITGCYMGISGRSAVWALQRQPLVGDRNAAGPQEWSYYYY